MTSITQIDTASAEQQKAQEHQYLYKLHDPAIPVHPTFHFDRSILQFWEDLSQSIDNKAFPRYLPELDLYEPGVYIHQSRSRYREMSERYAKEMLAHPKKYEWFLSYIEQMFASDDLSEKIKDTSEVDVAVLGCAVTEESIDRANAASLLISHLINEKRVRVSNVLLSGGGSVPGATEAMTLYQAIGSKHSHLQYRFDEKSASTFENIVNLQPHLALDRPTIVKTGKFHVARVRQAIDIILGSQSTNGHSHKAAAGDGSDKMLESLVRISDDRNKHALARYDILVVGAADVYDGARWHKKSGEEQLASLLMESLFILDNYRRTEENRKHNLAHYHLWLRDQEGYHASTKNMYPLSHIHQQIKYQIDESQGWEGEY